VHVHAKFPGMSAKLLGYRMVLFLCGSVFCWGGVLVLGTVKVKYCTVWSSSTGEEEKVVVP
jgi:hypothetical protein